MTVRGHPRFTIWLIRQYKRLGILLFLPAVLAHELTHAIAAYPWARVDGIKLIPPRTYLAYPDSTPNGIIRVVNVAPTVVGLCFGLVVFQDISVQIWPLPHPSVVYAFALWITYTAPSPGDLQPFSN